ncbi:MAG: hypothetical protein ACJA0H_001175 [Francisellaceae bacterium]|jgi:hypothetical protein
MKYRLSHKVNNKNYSIIIIFFIYIFIGNVYADTSKENGAMIQNKKTMSELDAPIEGIWQNQL